MEIGSVRFFKRLIAGTVLGLLALSCALAVILGVRYYNRNLQLSNLSSEVELLSNELLQQKLSSFSTLALPEQSNTSADDSLDYQQKYPDLYVTGPKEYTTGENVCYLTFDDGPSAQTAKNLDLLKEKGVHATFFVTGQNSEANPDLLRRIVAEGHTLGVHTYSHNYKQIYASVDAFLDDFYQMWSTVYQITGEKPTVFRFAGGSINAYNRTLYQDIVSEMLRRGFTYYDWNVSSGDAATGISSAQILSGVVDNFAKHKQAIVLMHDRADNTATSAVLGQMIDTIQAAGYTFDRLTNSVAPVTFAYPN